MTKPSAAKLTPAEVRARKARRAWIPTATIGGLIVIAIVVAIVTHASGAGKHVVLKAGDSHFNKAGVAEIVKTADAQVDVRGHRSASAIDLPPNATRTFGPYNGIAAELDLVGVHGTDSLFVDTFSITTKNNYLTKISTISREFDYTDLHTQLESLGVVGISNKQMAAFEDAMPAGAGTPTSHFSLRLGTGNDLGVPTTVAVACQGAKGCAVTTLTTITHP